VTALDSTPYQTPPALKNASALVDTNEYGVLWTGQSNGRPWGFPEDGLAQEPALLLQAAGLDLTAVVIPDHATRQFGETEWITVDATVKAAQWNTGTFLRLGTPQVPLHGYAIVLDSRDAMLQVQWISLPANNATVAGYLVRENPGTVTLTAPALRFAAYDQVRVLTPFQPVNSIIPPLSGAPVSAWFAPPQAPYPAVNTKAGQRLTLPAPYTLPAGVTTFDDLALFLPLSRREGSHGWGISEIADSSFNGVGTPTGHPVTTIAAGVWTFVNSIGVAELVNAFLIVDWHSAGVAKRGWARIATNNATSFTPNPGSWLGDGAPPTPATAAVTFDTATDEVIWTTHGFGLGDPVFFTGTTPPAGVTFGRVYLAFPTSADRFKLIESLYHQPLDIGAGAVGVTGFQCWRYTCWVPHWKDNPHMWLPGPEFAYPNEDQQPQASYVHWRARGQVLFGHTGSTSPADPDTGDAKFGALLPFAWRMASALGKRMNVIALAINSSSLPLIGVLNTAGYAGQLGWWSYERFGFGLALEGTSGVLATRLRRLVTFIAGQALTAEANTKPLRFLAAAHVQGEGDALLGTRELYGASITDYRRFVRDLIDSAGYGSFVGDALLPFVMPLITRVYEVGAAGSTSVTTGGSDPMSDVNNAIREVLVSERFSAAVLSEDLPKLNYGLGTTDPGHYSGQGFAALGARLAAAALDVLEYALSYTAPVLSAVNARLLRIANLALLYVGHGARQIASLTENTAEARIISAALPHAMEHLLSLRQWSWALRREPLPPQQVGHGNPRWLYAYVVPGRAVSPVAILPPDAAPGSTPAPVSEFEIGRSPSGARLLFTNVAEIAADLTAAAATDGLIHSERLPRTPTLTYIEHVVDPDRYSPSFTEALIALLVSKIAPALVRGQEGETLRIRWLQTAGGFIRNEAQHENATRQVAIEHTPDWIGAR
jgi:hypothetical protein